MNNEFPSSKVICHSKAPNGEELITLEIELHRYILSEFNTHRSLSRNFQSSRAVPVEKMIQQVRDNPAMPVHWGANQRGMVADKELIGKELHNAQWGWLSSAKEAADCAEYMLKQGCHKQIVNRLLEPFMKTKGVVTATREAFEALFLLRCHKDAQPEFKLLAERMRASIEASKPQELKYGQYHLPYVDKYDSGGNPSYYDCPENAIKISTSCNAQVSYRTLDDSLEKALKIYDMLNLPENGVYKEDPPHFSPTEHVAKVVEATWMEEREEGNTTYYYPDQSGNFNSISFWQYRKALEIGLENEFIND